MKQTYLPFLSLAFCAAALAADPPNPADPSLPPEAFDPSAAFQPAPAQPQPSAPRPLGATTPPPASGEEMVPRIEFPNSDVRDILSFYGRLTGKKMIFDNTVSGPITLVVTTPVPKSEAVRIIETSLLLNGFSLVPGDGDIMKVAGLTKNPRTIGIPIISDELEIPDTDKVVTFLFKLQYADPTEMQQVLAQYIAPSQYTSIVALPKAGALLLTESSPVIRTLVRVVREIDNPPATVVSEFIKLERADVEDVIEKLEKIFEKEPSQPGGILAQRAAGQVPQIPGQPPQPDAPTQGSPSIEFDGGNILSEDSIIIGKIRLTADIRTNRIHVVTRPINLPFVRKLITEFDQDVKFGEPETRKLKFVAAGEIFETIVQAISEKGKDGQTPSVPGGASGSNQFQNQSNSFSLRGGSNDLSSSSGSTGGLSVSEGLETQPRETSPIAVVVGTTKIIADRRNNSIIVLGNREIKQKIFSLLDELDVRAPQVVISTVIGTYSRDLSTDIGVDYFLGNADVDGANAGSDGDSDGDGDGATPAVISSRSGIGIGQATGIPFIDFARILTARDLSQITPFLVGGASGFTGYGAVGDSLGVIVRALEQSGRFRVTQRPVVITSNNKKAIIASGEEIAVPTQTLTNVTDGGVVSNQAAVQSNVQFKQVTLQLEVVPLVNPDREVSLDILQKLDSLTGQFTEIGGNQIPTIATRYIRTNVSAPNGATLILGGLIREEESDSETGVPYLNRIPLLGNLFKRKIKDKTRAELVILMRPRVIETAEEIADITNNETGRVDAAQDLEATVDVSSGKRASKEKITPTPTPVIRIQR